MEDEYYNHTVTIDMYKSCKDSEKKLWDFIKLGKPVYIDRKTGKIHYTLEDFIKENPDYLK